MRTISDGTRSELAKAIEYEILDQPTEIMPPSLSQLKLVFMEAAVPFIGFGFMDNAVMICVGDYIDATAGLVFGISTMAAAGIGNTVSDATGVFLGSTIESVSLKMGMPTAKLSRAQRGLKETKLAQYSGNLVGVIVGCIIGMVPLLFMEPGRKKVGNQAEIVKKRVIAEHEGATAAEAEALSE
jgi:hypothetical protein